MVKRRGRFYLDELRLILFSKKKRCKAPLQFIYFLAKGSSKVIDVIMKIIFGAIFIDLPFMLTIYPIISSEIIFMVSYIVGVISLFISNTCLVHLKKS